MDMFCVRIHLPTKARHSTGVWAMSYPFAVNEAEKNSMVVSKFPGCLEDKI